MGSLGYVMQVPEEEKYLMSQEELLARIVTLYGGRAAEELIFNSITTGASNDIEKATKLARAMITQYGMSEKFGLMGLESVENQYLDGRTVLNCGDATAAKIDKEVMRLLKECYEEAKALLADNKDVLDKIADFLFEKETITGKEFMEIYNKVRGIEPKVEITETKDYQITNSDTSTEVKVEIEDVQVLEETELNTAIESEEEKIETDSNADTDKVSDTEMDE
jgi:cell division protease FtsH